ncbi:MAG TPA: CPBP family intramembrane glutamic endopeptidase, partial [Vicinamibacteria bacterium]|nr:CPBP family intramembrane glutamic endopeptidase [Vicinamibacteria bacterium]
LFPITIVASLASAAVVYRMVRRSLPGRLASGALAEIGWVPSTRAVMLGGALVGAFIALLYLRVAIVIWPMSPRQSIGPLATAVTRSSGWGLQAWALLLVLVAPPLEEFVFRGALFAGLRRSWGVLPAAVIVTAVFVAAHISETHLYYPALASLATMAICGLLARMRTGSLLPSIALHGAYNLMVVVAVYAQAA